MKFKFRTDERNDDYLVILEESAGTFNMGECGLSGMDISTWQEMRALTIAKLNNGGDIYILKSSLIGEWLLAHADGKNYINDDSFISYNKVVGALNIAIFSNEVKMTNKILPLFQGRVEGTREELMDVFSESVLDYILEHPNFSEYLEKVDGNQTTNDPVLVYSEAGKCEMKIIHNRENVKTLK